jgi:two-component system cell cycle response regulator DivK
LRNRDRHPARRPAFSVLIVEDHPDTLEMYAAYFRAHGFRVMTATDGASAISRARYDRPSVIVMDLSLPHVDGWEATRRLKQHPATSRIPVIACSSHVLAGSTERALEAGCDVFLAKPCLPDLLLAETRKILRRPAFRRRA